MGIVRILKIKFDLDEWKIVEDEDICSRCMFKLWLLLKSTLNKFK